MWDTTLFLLTVEVVDLSEEQLLVMWLEKGRLNIEQHMGLKEADDF